MGFVRLFAVGLIMMVPCGLVAAAAPNGQEALTLESIFASDRFSEKLPQDNPHGYREGAPLHFAKSMTGRLLICHGTADNNVHLQNTAQMADEYINAGKLFDLMLYPRIRHGVRMSRYRLHFHTLKAEFLERYLI
jgi:dipeptidyl-peptidase-4